MKFPHFSHNSPPPPKLNRFHFPFDKSIKGVGIWAMNIIFFFFKKYQKVLIKLLTKNATKKFALTQTYHLRALVPSSLRANIQ